MLQFVLRCYRVPLRVGKVVRHTMRHHWGLSHTAARVIWHGAWVSCVVVPLALGGARWFIPREFAPGGGLRPFEPIILVPEPSGVWVFGVGVVALLLIKHGTR